MHKTIFLVLISITLSNISFAQNRIALIKKDGKFGFINDKGKYIAEPIYEEAFSFSENFAPVMVDGKWGFIDKSGQMVIEPQYDYANWFWEGLAAVKKGEKYGYINPKNQLVIPFQYDYTFSFSEGLSMVEMDGKAGYINKSGEVVIPVEYAQAFDFYKGIGPVQDAEGRIFFIDKKGKKVDKPFLNHLILKKQDYIYFYENDRIGIKNKRGKVLTTARYDALGTLYKNRVFYKIGDEKYGITTKYGTIKRKPHYDDVQGFSEGLAAVKIDGEWGYIHHRKGMVIAPRFEDTRPFSKGLAAVKMNGKWGYINKKGTLVIPCQFDDNNDEIFVKVN